MPEFVVDDLRDGYRQIVAQVKAFGTPVEVRGMRTAELLGVSIVLNNPADALPVGVGRKLNSAIAAVEAAQLIAGESHPEIVCRIAPNFRNYMDGGTFHGAYGPRIAWQRYHVENLLRRDPTTRQAIMTIWDPAHDQRPGLSDYPCTTVLQFFVRDGQLDMQVYMRSNDVWRGLAYDAFQFTQLQFSIARLLEIPAGKYRHYAASLHLYDTDRDAAIEMLNTEPSTDVVPLPTGMSTPQAQCVLRGLWRPTEYDASVLWYIEKLRPYLREPVAA